MFWVYLLKVPILYNAIGLTFYIDLQAPPTTTTTTTTPLPPSGSPLESDAGGSSAGGSLDAAALEERTKVYVATGVVCGVLAFTVMVIVLVLVRVRTKRAASAGAAAGAVSSTYNADNCDAYRAYEPSPPLQSGITGGTLKKKSNNNNNQHHPHPSGASKAWQSETLPRYLSLL